MKTERNLLHECEYDDGLARLLAALPEDQQKDPNVRARVLAALDRARAARTRRGDSSAGLPGVLEMPNHEYSAGYRYAMNGGMPKVRNSK